MSHSIYQNAANSWQSVEWTGFLLGGVGVGTRGAFAAPQKIIPPPPRKMGSESKLTDYTVLYYES